VERNRHLADQVGALFAQSEYFLKEHEGSSRAIFDTLDCIERRRDHGPAIFDRRARLLARSTKPVAGRFRRQATAVLVDHNAMRHENHYPSSAERSNSLASRALEVRSSMCEKKESTKTTSNVFDTALRAGRCARAATRFPKLKSETQSPSHACRR